MLRINGEGYQPKPYDHPLLPLLATIVLHLRVVFYEVAWAIVS